MAKNVLTIDADQYEDVVLGADVPVVLDFFSTECPPCEAVASKFERLAKAYGEDVRFIKIFRQGNRELATELGVSGSPTLVFYKDGQEVGSRLTGGIKNDDLKGTIDALLDPARVAELEARIETSETECDVLILGGGPAGLTAGIYSGQAKLKTIVVDKGLAGGQVATTHMVSNFPGFPEPQHGYMLAHYMREHTVAAGVEFREAVDITQVDWDKRQIVLDGVETITAKKIVLATGTSARVIGVQNEEEYKGRGISYCATCDGKYYDGAHLVVIGGGNSAIEEALFLTRFADKITIVHQFAELQANQEAQERAFAEPKINFVFETEPRVFVPTDGTIKGVEVEHLPTGERRTIECDGVFIFAGMAPNLDGFDEAFELDEWGFVKVDGDLHTSVPHVLAAGDIRSKRYRQVTTAVSDGTIASMVVARELGEGQ